ncbi:MAG: transferrin-binding protein-like solute binding protein [Nitrospira sp. SB0662_bin_26]|nr:transferrin-binding protein-like solute binding protein [Nitrospira sp. SB0662_bin_26]
MVLFIRRSVILSCILFLLTACGGGGGGSSAMRPSEPQPPPAMNTQTAFGEAGTPPEFSAGSSRPTIRGQLKQSPPAFGGVAMNLYSPNLAPVRSVDTTFTGDRFTLSVRRTNGSGFTLDTDRHYAEVVSDSTTTPNLVTERPFATGYMVDVSGSRVAIAGATVEWSNADVTDYLAGGYWVTFDPEARSVDMGAFIDGTDYPTPRDAAYTLPVTGTATYNGLAGGLYLASAGTDAQQPGALAIGEYRGRATLTADFGTMRIGGKVDQIEAGGGLIELPNGTQYAAAVEATDIEMIFRPVSINQNGTFFGDNVDFTSRTYNIIKSLGSWAGQFSTVEDARGNPRAAAGTNTGYLETAGGSRAVLTGAFYGATERFE